MEARTSKCRKSYFTDKGADQKFDHLQTGPAAASTCIYRCFFRIRSKMTKMSNILSLTHVI